MRPAGRRGRVVLRTAEQSGQLPAPGLANLGAGLMPLSADLRLFLSDEWTGDAARTARADVSDQR